MQRLLESGRTKTGIAEESELPWTTVWRVLNMKSETILRSTSEKILRVKPALDDRGVVDATGTVRRLRALVAMGHRVDTLSAEVGCSVTYISTLTRVPPKVVSAPLARAVERAYGKLSMTVGPSTSAQMKAQRLGWDVPLAWDDETIDDPSAVPMKDALAPVATEGGNVAARWLMGESVVLCREDRREVLAHLYEWTNDTTAEIAERLGMTPAAAERQWERMKERSAAEGRRLWRRVYVPRERDLKQNEMGEAA